MSGKQPDQPDSNLPKLAAPARRALDGAGITRLEQLTRFGEDEIGKLHGIGPNALDALRRALAGRRLSFADTLRLRPWADGDLPLLEKLLGDPAMTEHLGGPESAEKLAERQGRYVAMTDPTAGRMFAILVGPDSKPAGSVGYWEKEWQGEWDYEMGWSVLPAFQGRGVATRATLAAMEALRPVAKHRFVHAYPSVENAASNAICRKVGFSFVGALDFEYPKGHPMRCNDWRLDLQEKP
jgi:RimJ/RimL family protein N-acetyltransferase